MGLVPQGCGSSTTVEPRLSGVSVGPGHSRIPETTADMQSTVALKSVFCIVIMCSRVTQVQILHWFLLLAFTLN